MNKSFLENVDEFTFNNTDVVQIKFNYSIDTARFLSIIQIFKQYSAIFLVQTKDWVVNKQYWPALQQEVELYLQTHEDSTAALSAEIAKRKRMKEQSVIEE